MYITQEIANRIKIRIKECNIVTKDMLSELNMGINAISEFSKGKQMSCISLARIADYLDCSVDYLLGRTDDPELHTLKVTNKMEIRRETIPYRLAAYGGENEVVEDDDESKTT